MTNSSVAIITCYHFDNSPKNQEAYQRLVRSVCASYQQLQALGPNNRLILVANGVNEGAIAPEHVVASVQSLLPSFCQETIHTCFLELNGEIAGGLNCGVNAALHEIGEVEWIASVQSSAIIQNKWLSTVLDSGLKDASVGAAFGRILVEENQDLIWTDGHFLKEGRTFDANYHRRIDETKLCPPGQFPCLSASLFRKSLVRKMWHRYGDFVSNHLCQYGDCTDVALRARSVEPSVLFKYSEGARALKRRPTLDPCNIAASQLLAASRYYSPEHREKREADLKGNAKYSSCLPFAKIEADKRLEKKYSPKSSSPPPGAPLDLVW